jgi:hypothetical protein
MVGIFHYCKELLVVGNDSKLLFMIMNNKVGVI